MPITLRELSVAAGRQRPQRIAKSLNEAIARNVQTAFLCHSHNDNRLAEGLQVFLAENGWDVYLDWQDTAMPSEPNRETADRIKRKIQALDWFLFLATPNSTVSRWCPWEIGYADREKQHDKILLIRTTDENNRYYGNEYLQLYAEIAATTLPNKWAVFPEDKVKKGVLLEHLR